MAMRLAALLATLLIYAVAAAAAAAATCGSDCRSFSPANFRACLLAIQPGGRAVFPEDAAYEHARSNWNSRVVASPAAVYFAHDTEGAAAAMACAYRWGVRASPAAGRQSLQGAAVADGYLVVDVSNMTSIVFSSDNTTVSVGAGATAVQVTAAVYDSGIPGAAVPSGGCPYVGAGGYYTGGGLGIPGRWLGLHCDSVVGLEAVLANGSVVRAAKGLNEDLLWASCGGGGGTFALVTRFDLRVHRLPNGGRMASVDLTYKPGYEGILGAWSNFQRWLPTADWRFDFTFGLSRGKLSFNGLFLGSVEEALRLLETGGVLQHLDPGTPMDAELSDVSDKYPFGLRLKAQPHYFFVHAEGTIFWTDIYGVPTPWPPFTPYHKLTAAQREHLGRLMRGTVEPPVLGGQGYSAWFNTQSRLTGLLPQEGVQALARYFADAMEACAANASSVACHCSMGGHVLGGAYASASSDASAFPFRDKYFILNGMTTLQTRVARQAPPSLLQEAIDLNNAFLGMLKPHLGEREAGYVDYMLPSFSDWRRGYWGANYERLQAIKAKYDPTGVFSKPFTVEGSAAAAAPPACAWDGNAAADAALP